MQRQVQRLKHRYRPDSTDWVQHGNHGRGMPWALCVPQKHLILTLARGRYHGFNDSPLLESRIEGRVLRAPGNRTSQAEVAMVARLGTGRVEWFFRLGFSQSLGVFHRCMAA